MGMLVCYKSNKREEVLVTAFMVTKSKEHFQQLLNSSPSHLCFLSVQP